jgi:hypothetical protein
MPIFEISFNDYEETWEAYRVDWEDESRVLDVVAINTYHISISYPNDLQNDYSVFLERDNVGDAFSAGVKMIEAKINEQIL